MTPLTYQALASLSEALSADLLESHTRSLGTITERREQAARATIRHQDETDTLYASAEQRAREYVEGKSS